LHCFQFLAGFGEEAFSGHEIGVRTGRRTDSQVDHPSAAQRAGRPEPVARALEHADRAAEVVEGGPVAAEGAEHHAAPVQHPSHRDAGGQVDSTVKGGEPVCRPARVDERPAQGTQHIGLALRGPGPPGQPQRRSQLTYTGADVAGIAQDDPGGLMSDRGLIRARTPSQDRTRPGQCLLRAGQGQRQQIVHVTLTGSGCKHPLRHEPMLGPHILAVHVVVGENMFYLRSR